MNTAERIQKLAMYKLAIATGDMTIGKTKSVGKKADDPEKLKKDTTLTENIIDKMSPNLAIIPAAKAVDSMVEYGNLMADQSTPIGELFSDFAKDRLKKKGLKGEIYYTQTHPRSNVPARQEDNILKKIYLSTQAPKTESSSIFLPSERTDKWIKDNIAKPFSKDLTFNYEQLKKVNPELVSDEKGLGLLLEDRFIKGMRSADDFYSYVITKKNVLKAKNPKLTTSEALYKALKSTGTASELYKNPKAIVKTPRNNLRAIAHEYGHIESEMGNEKITNSVIGPVYDSLRRLLSSPSVEYYNNYAPEGLKKFLGGISDNLNKTRIGSYFNSFIQNGVLGKMRTLPSQAVLAANTLSVISPDTMKKLEENDPTGILKLIDEHPVASSVIAKVPQVVREAATTIPGTMTTYEFWKALKNGNNAFMKNNAMADAVRKGTKGLSKISPGWEAAKFFGKNLGKTTLAVTAPMVGYMALEKLKNWIGNKDDSALNESNN